MLFFLIACVSVETLFVTKFVSDRLPQGLVFGAIAWFSSFIAAIATAIASAFIIDFFDGTAAFGDGTNLMATALRVGLSAGVFAAFLVWSWRRQARKHQINAH